MAENLLTDAKVRNATKARDGMYLSDGGGLRIRLLDPSPKHPKGARIAQFDFKLKKADGKYLSASVYVGTIGEPFTDPKDGAVRDFTLADARKARDDARTKVADGKDPREAARLERLEEIEAQRNRLAELDSRRTVRKAFGEWDTLYLSKHRTDGGSEVRDLFGRHILPKLGDRPLDTIRRSDVTEILRRLTGAGKRRTANMVLALLRQFFKWSRKQDWMTGDPTLDLAREDAGGKESTRERNLTELEIIELRDKMSAAKLPERMCEAVWLLLATGVRVGELSGAPLSEFDFDAAEWHIPKERTKNNDAHIVHLSPFALARARRLAELAKGSSWLLPGRNPKDADPSVTKPVSEKLLAKLLNDRQRAVPLKGRSKAAGSLSLARGKWVPHDLRRTMASRMGDLGIRPDVIERCLNHRPEGVVAVYQRAKLMPERRAAFDAWGETLERLMATASPTNVTALPTPQERAAQRSPKRVKSA
jgi:integrase